MREQGHYDTKGFERDSDHEKHTNGSKDRKQGERELDERAPKDAYRANLGLRSSDSAAFFDSSNWARRAA